MVTLSQEEKIKQENFREEILPHLDALYNFALQFTFEPNDAQDLVQETMVKAYRFFRTYKKGTNARAWLYRILKNSYINEYRKKSKQPDRVEYNEVVTANDAQQVPGMDSENGESYLFGDDIVRALGKLPEEYRTIILLCDVESFTYEEIANMLDIPIGTIRSRLHRGRNRLKELLGDYLDVND